MDVFEICEYLNNVLSEEILKCLQIPPQEECKRLKIKYALQVILVEVERFILLLLFFCLAGQGMDFLIAFCSLISLRIFMGGTHCQTALGCLFQSLLTFSGILIIENTITINPFFSVLLYYLAMILIWISTPIPSVKRIKYTHKQRIRFKRKAFAALTIQIIAGIIVTERIRNIMLSTLLFQLVDVGIIVLKNGGDKNG